jgi:hypothetical protein
MDELLSVIIQFTFEFLLNVFIDIPFEWPSRNRKTPEREDIAGICFIWFLAGAGLAGLSLLVFPNTFISWPQFRIANLLLAPLVSAILSRAIARRRSEMNPNIVPRNHFWQSFWFTVGLVATRFAFAGRA